MSLVIPLGLAACGTPESVWLAYPPAGAPDTIMLSLAADPAHAGWLFAGSSQGDIYHLSATATSLPAPLSTLPVHGAVDALAPDPATPNALYASGTGGAFFSADGGAHWQRRDNGLPSTDEVNALAWTTDGRALLAGTGAHGVYRSADGGQTWLPASDGLPPKADVYALYRAPGAPVILASVLDVGLFASTDNGAHWTSWTSRLAAREIFALLAAPGPQSENGAPTLYAGTSQGLYASVDGGKVWTQDGFGQGLPSGRVLSLAADAQAPGTLYAGTDQQVYRSNDGGKHWSAVGPGLSHQVAALLVVHQAGRLPLVFAGAGDLYRFPRIAPPN